MMCRPVLCAIATKLLLIGVLAASFAAVGAEAPVHFVSCPKCDKRMRKGPEVLPGETG